MGLAMSKFDASISRFEIVELGPERLPDFARHLHRIECHGLRMRFGGKVGASFLHDYAHRVDFTSTLLLGVFVEGELRGIGELRSFEKVWCPRAEAAFTVEEQFRGLGMGTAIMQAMLERAVARRVRELYLAINPLNQPMRRVAERFGGTFENDGEELHARVPVPAL